VELVEPGELVREDQWTPMLVVCRGAGVHAGDGHVDLSHEAFERRSIPPPHERREAAAPGAGDDRVTSREQVPDLLRGAVAGVELGRDPQGVLGGVADTWDFVLAHVGIGYRSQLTQDDGEVIVRCWLDSFGRSSVCTREEIVKLDGTVSAEAESVIVPRSPDEPKSRPLTEEERAILQRELDGA